MLAVLFGIKCKKICSRSQIMPKKSASTIGKSLSAWDYRAKTHLIRLLILQIRAFRLIFFRRAREHAIPLFIKFIFLPISFLFFQQLCCLMYDIQTQVAPLNLLDQFKLPKSEQYITITTDRPQMSVLL